MSGYAPVPELLRLADGATATEPGWCARCGFAPCLAVRDLGAAVEDDGTCMYSTTEPWTLDVWLGITAGRALRAVGLDDPGTEPSLVRALGERIAWRAGSIGGGGRG